MRIVEYSYNGAPYYVVECDSTGVAMSSNLKTYDEAVQWLDEWQGAKNAQ